MRACPLMRGTPTPPPPGTYELRWSGLCNEDGLIEFRPTYTGPTTFTVP